MSLFGHVLLTAELSTRHAINYLRLFSQGAPARVPRVDVLEADLIVLMSALCRLAARRQAGTDADLYVKAGKKLASDILMKVLHASTQTARAAL